MNRASIQEEVYVRGDGAIVIGISHGSSDWTPSEKRRVLSLVEDHIYVVSGGDGEERIDWPSVWGDFDKEVSV